MHEILWAIGILLQKGSRELISDLDPVMVAYLADTGRPGTYSYWIH
jgi:hypothetical protein